MKVFISWSGNTSKRVAEALHRWLPYMIQSVEPFMSSDISKGNTWSDDLARELENAEYGIVCVTPYNVSHPWMLFEAGALVHSIDKSQDPHDRPRDSADNSCVTPLLFGVSPKALADGPLAKFQATDLGSRDDFYRLVTSINRTGADHRPSDDVLEKTFSLFWPELKEELDGIKRDPEETSTFYNWLCSLNDIRTLDFPCQCEVVWFVTSDVLKYVLESDARKAITETFRGEVPARVRYRCLYPEPQFNRHDAQLEQLRIDVGGAFEYRAVNGERFTQLAPTDFIIFDKGAAADPIAFVRAPVRDNGGDYWFRAEHSAADAFRKRFESLWSEAVVAG